MELLKVGRDKRARRLTKKRVRDEIALWIPHCSPNVQFFQLGTMVRAKKKVEELSNVLQAQRRAQ